MLRPALESVTRQTHPAIEIIFVDNNSTDGSFAVAEEVLQGQQSPCKVLRCAEPGANSARNYGYPFANGDYVQWMDADDLMDRDKVALQVEALEASLRFD